MVKPCPRCNPSGNNKFFMVLDPTSGPQKWRILCNNPRCKNMLQVATHAPEFVVNSKGNQCEKCMAKLIDIEFHKDAVPEMLVVDKKNKVNVRWQGCVFCDEMFNTYDMIDEVIDNFGDPRGSGDRGRGRGRGDDERGGRGGYRNMG